MRARHGFASHNLVDTLKYRAYLTGMSDAELDATGLLCPLPVLKARKRLKALMSGDRLIVLTDDPAALIDIPHFCTEAGHALLGSDTEGAVSRWVIRKR